MSIPNGNRLINLMKFFFLAAAGIFFGFCVYSAFTWLNTPVVQLHSSWLPESAEKSRLAVGRFVVSKSSLGGEEPISIIVDCDCVNVVGLRSIRSTDRFEFELQGSMKNESLVLPFQVVSKSRKVKGFWRIAEYYSRNQVIDETELEHDQIAIPVPPPTN